MKLNEGHNNCVKIVDRYMALTRASLCIDMDECLHVYGLCMTITLYREYMNIYYEIRAKQTNFFCLNPSIKSCSIV